MEQHALVTGGSGFVGGRLIQMLTAAGWRVRATGRTAAARRHVEALGATAVESDLTQRSPLEQAIQDCSVVFHAAALFKLWGSPREFDQVNVAGTQTLLTAARAAGVGRFVQIGASAVVMGDPAPLLGVTESEPVHMPAWAPYSASKARAEIRVREANDDTHFHTCVIRPPLIWGAGMPMLDRMIRSIEAGQFRWPGDGLQPMSTCHVDNVCHAAMLAVNQGAGGAAYFVSDGTDGTLRQVISDLLATRNVRPPSSSAPFGVAWFMASCMESAWRWLPLKDEPPLTRQMLRMIGMPFTLNIDRARVELGYEPVISWRDGIAAMHAR